MKKKIKQEIEVEISVCNLCEKEIDSEPFNKKRIEIVRNLFATKDFDAHEKCINTIIKNTFKKYFV